MHGKCEHTGKVCHESYYSAFKHMKRLAKIGEELHGYRCEWCGQWHVGHARKKVRKTMATAIAEKPMSTTYPNAIVLQDVAIEDYKNIRHLVIHVAGRHVGLRGPNGAGKSTVIEAIQVLLCGPSRVTRDPVRHGADKASIVGTFNKFVMTRSFDVDGTTKVVVKNRDGSKWKGDARQLYKDLIAAIPDPQKFTSARPQDQLDIVLSVCKVVPPVKQVEEITGEKIALLPGEMSDSYLGRLSADDTGLFFIRRTEANRVVTQKRGALEEATQLVNELGGPLAGEEVGTSPSALLEEDAGLSVLEGKRAKIRADKATEREEARAALNKSKADRDEVAHGLKMVESEHDKRIKECRDIEAEIARLQTILREKKDEAAALADRKAAGMNKLAEFEKYVADDQAALEAIPTDEQALAGIPDPAPRRAEIRTAIANIETTRKQSDKRRFACEQHQARHQEMEEAVNVHKRLDDMLTALRDLRARQLDSIDIGVKGLCCRDGELYLNDVPFTQASTGQRDEVGLLVIVKQNPDCRIAFCDNSERFDPARLDHMLEVAASVGWSIMYAVREERPVKEGEPFIEFRENGRAA